MASKALEAGADLYVSKQEIARDLVVSIEELARRRNLSVMRGASELADSGGKTAEARGADLEFLHGGGEVGALMQSMDWSKTKLGPMENWPKSLKTVVGICLSSRFDFC